MNRPDQGRKGRKKKCSQKLFSVLAAKENSLSFMLMENKKSWWHTANIVSYQYTYDFCIQDYSLQNYRYEPLIMPLLQTTGAYTPIATQPCLVKGYSSWRTSPLTAGTNPPVIHKQSLYTQTKQPYLDIHPDRAATSAASGIAPARTRYSLKFASAGIIR